MVRRAVSIARWEVSGFNSWSRDLGPNRGERTWARSRKSLAARWTIDVPQEAFAEVGKRSQEAGLGKRAAGRAGRRAEQGTTSWLAGWLAGWFGTTSWLAGWLAG